MLELVGVYLRPVLYPSNGKLLDEGMHISASLTTRRHSERKEGVGSKERTLILVFLPLDCVGEVFFWMSCLILQIGAGARVNDGNAVEASYSCVEGGYRRVYLCCYVYVEGSLYRFFC